MAGGPVRGYLLALQVGYDQLLRGEEAFAEAAGSGQDTVLTQAHRNIAVGGGYIPLLVEEATDADNLLPPFLFCSAIPVATQSLPSHCLVLSLVLSLSKGYRSKDPTTNLSHLIVLFLFVH
jgi:hypothetical protein